MLKHLKILLLMLLWLAFMPQQLVAAIEKADSINEAGIITVDLLMTSDDGVESMVPATFKLIESDTVLLQLGDGKRAAIPTESKGSITIPHEITVDSTTYYVTTIADRAFALCRNLTVVTFDSGISYFGSSVFLKCELLRNIVITGNVYQLQSDMISKCPEVQNLRFSSNVLLDTLPDRFCAGMTKLRNVTLPKNLKHIGSEAFMGCIALTQITLPAMLESMGDRVFAGCSRLMTFATTDSLKSMGNDIFEGSVDLRYVDLRKSVGLISPDLKRDGGLLASVPEEAIVYLPKGMESTEEMNVVATDITGAMTCSMFVVNHEVYSLERCQSGEATYWLNRYFGGNSFRQAIGVDDYPMPSLEYLKRVFMVTFQYEDSACVYRYVNTGKTVLLPTSEEMGINYNLLTYYYKYANRQTPFTSHVTVSQDILVTVGLKRLKGDVNGDGVIDVQDITAMINGIMGMPSDDYYAMNADLDDSGEVNVVDITSLINSIMQGNHRDLLDGGLNILALGNSFACDAYSYVPYVLQQSMPFEDVYFGILYHGAGSLMNHYNNHMVNKEPYDTYYNFNATGNWHAMGGNVASVDSILTSRDWDIVLLQQFSDQSRNYYYYQPYFNNLVDSIKSKVPGAHIGWLINPSYADGFIVGSDTYSSDSMFVDVAQCAQRLLNETELDFVIPAGTAIQNARHTSLDALGKFGHLSFDGRHLQDGLPCLIEALTVAQTLADYIGEDAPVEDVDLAVTDSWATNTAVIPQFAGPVIGMSASQVRLGKKCVKAAIENPLEVTLVTEGSGKGQDGDQVTEQ